MACDLHINTRSVLLVMVSLALTYFLAVGSFMISWMNFWLRGPYFLSYQVIYLMILAVMLLWWLRYHTGLLPVLSTVAYSAVAGYVSGLMGMALYPIAQPDGFELIARSLQFPTPEAVAAFFWFPIRMLSWLFGGLTGAVMIGLSRQFTWFRREPTQG